MDFPRNVYIVPGPHPRHGGSYGLQSVADEDERKEALKIGYFDTLTEAIEASLKPKVVKESPKVTGA